MNIQISGGVATGLTELTAFDKVLVDSGVANFNLIYLSSVIPPGSKVEVANGPKTPEGSWGDRLYVVIAQKRTSQRNQEVWAGIGWMQNPESGLGLLIEHEGHSETEVRADIHNTMAGLAKNRDMQFNDTDMHVVGGKCIDEPICALVVAVFESRPWRNVKPDA